MFLHRRPSEHAHFRRILTSDGHRLKMTDFHLVWAGCSRLRLLRAMDLRSGDCLYALVNSEGKNATLAMENGQSETMTRLASTKIVRIEQVD